MTPGTEQPTDLQRFGELVRERRKHRGWTLETLAGMAFSNIDRKGHVSDIELGKPKALKSSTVRSLAVALDIEPEEIPTSLRWPEANSALRPSGKVVQDVYDQVALLVGRETEAAREVGFRDGALIELANRYTGSTPKDFDAAVASLSEVLEQTRQAATQDQLAEEDSRAYRLLLAKLADIEASMLDRQWSVRRRWGAAVLGGVLALAIGLVTVFASNITGLYHRFSIAYFRPDGAVARLLSEARYFDEAGNARSHEGLSEYEAAIYNRGRGLDSEADARAAQALLEGCPNSNGLDLAALDLRTLSLDKIREHCGRVTLSDVDFRGSGLPRVSFPPDTNLSRSRFSGATLAGTEFGNADVTGASFDCADISGADFRNVRGLTQTQLSNAVCGYGSMCGPKLPVGVAMPSDCTWIEDYREANDLEQCSFIPPFHAVDTGQHGVAMRSCFRDHLARAE